MRAPAAQVWAKSRGFNVSAKVVHTTIAVLEVSTAAPDAKPNDADPSARPLIVFRGAGTRDVRPKTLATVSLEINQTFNPARI